MASVSNNKSWNFIVSYQHPCKRLSQDYWNKNRLVCIHLNALFMLIQNVATKIWISKNFEFLCWKFDLSSALDTRTKMVKSPGRHSLKMVTGMRGHIDPPFFNLLSPIDPGSHPMTPFLTIHNQFSTISYRRTLFLTTCSSFFFFFFFFSTCLNKVYPNLYFAPKIWKKKIKKIV